MIDALASTVVGPLLTPLARLAVEINFLYCCEEVKIIVCVGDVVGVYKYLKLWGIGVCIAKVNVVTACMVPVL